MGSVLLFFNVVKRKRPVLGARICISGLGLGLVTATAAGSVFAATFGVDIRLWLGIAPVQEFLVIIASLIMADTVIVIVWLVHVYLLVVFLM